jgi:diguanylate cyclase (GGDEF)-like protein
VPTWKRPAEVDVDPQDSLASILIDFAKTMLTEFNVQGILDELVARIVDVLPVTGAGVTLITPGLVPEYIAASNAAAETFERLQTEFAEGPCRTAYETGEAVAVPDLALDRTYRRFGPVASVAGMAAAFSFPLRHKEGRLGALDLYRDTPGPLSPRDMTTAQTLADVVAAYLINARSRERALEDLEWFRDQALHDALTGLANRVLLHERLEHAAQRAARTQSPSAVLFADLDQFKDINDTHGHGVGDAVLVAVANRLAKLVRPGDTLARISGDEFVILCEDFARSDVAKLVGRIEQAFAAPFVIGDLDVTVTASLGLATSGPGKPLSSQLLLEADTAMYDAKRARRTHHEPISLTAYEQRTSPG